MELIGSLLPNDIDTTVCWLFLNMNDLQLWIMNLHF
jgi:hypothetical protein